jgi:hypothetical protein
MPVNRLAKKSSSAPSGLFLITDFIKIKRRHACAARQPSAADPIAPSERLPTAAEFHRLAEVPPEIEWRDRVARSSGEIE